MADKKMEGVERRLSETHDPIDLKSTSAARESTSVADIEGIEQLVTPPRGLVKALGVSHIEGAACDQAFVVIWPKGEWKNMPISGFCSEPLCVTTGSCTGPRFVPHHEQWTTTEAATRQRRIPAAAEVVAAVRSMAKRARAQTGRDDERTDKEILQHVKMVWLKTIASIRGQSGEWRR